MAWRFNPDTGLMEDDGQEDPANTYDRSSLYSDTNYTGGPGAPADFRPSDGGGTAYTGGSDAEIAQMVADAKAHGVAPSIIDTFLSGVKSASSWMSGNKELSTALLSGIGSGMKDKLSNEQMDKKHGWDVQTQLDKQAREDSLWERRNQSIIGMKPPSRGIIGQHLFDAQLARIGK